MPTRVDLRTIPLLDGLKPASLERINTASVIERYEKGQVVFRQGESAAATWVVLAGWVHLVRNASNGSDSRQGAVLFTITPKEGLCGVSALDSRCYQLSGIAATSCTLLRIPVDAFRSAVRQDPELAYRALRLCTRRIERIAQQYGAMTEPVNRRVIRSILRLREQFGNRLPVTHRELGQMSWTTTESAIRAVRKLKRDGYVSGARGQLVVRHSAALQQLLAGVNGGSGI